MVKAHIDYAGSVVSRKDARELGVPRYWTGKPCKNGHLAPRWVSNGACFGCLAMWASIEKSPEKKQAKLVRKRERYRENADTISERRAEIYRQNPEKYRAQSVASYWRNPETRRAAAVAWNAANKDVVTQRNAAYYEADKEGQRARALVWYYENPEKASALRQNRRARVKAAEGSYTAEELQNLFRLQRGKCTYCCTSLKSGYHVDHYIPLARGGTNWISNIRLACKTCNLKKSAKDPLKFAQENGLLLI